MMTGTRRVCGVALLVVAGFSAPSRAEGLHEKLAFLAPLVGQPWQGEMALPDGRRLPITQTYEAIWDGRVVHYTRAIPNFPFFAEGYIYWDANEQRVCLFDVNSRGGARRGVVTLDEGVITVSGQMTMDGRTYDYRNAFVLGDDGTLTDRWFQNETGSWQPGHVVEFARSGRQKPNQGWQPAAAGTSAQHPGVVD